MRLEGSCHCGAVKFSAPCHTPNPYLRCYCGICRKTAGGGGYAINIKAEYDGLEITGEEHIGTYQAWMNPERTERSEGVHKFCRECGTALWVWDPRWPDMFHPHASCVDTPLPTPPETHHFLIEFAPTWVGVPAPSDHDHVHRVADLPMETIIEQMESIDDWHKNRHLWVD